MGRGRVFITIRRLSGILFMRGSVAEVYKIMKARGVSR